MANVCFGMTRLETKVEVLTAIEDIIILNESSERDLFIDLVVDRFIFENQ